MAHIVYNVASWLLLFCYFGIGLTQVTGINKDYEDYGLSFDWPGDIYAIGDLHGDFENAVKVLQLAKVINQSLHWIPDEPRKLLISVGDVTDRGPDGYVLLKLFQNLTTAALSAGGRVINLLGNHECLNVCKEFAYTSPDEIRRHYNKSKGIMIKSWSANGDIGALIRKNFHVAVRVNGTIFVHAGIVGNFATMTLEELDRKMEQQLWHRPGCLPQSMEANLLSEDGPVWTRSLTQRDSKTSCSMLASSLRHLKSDRMVVGHDVTQSGRIELRCNNKLIRIDTGISRYVQNSPSILKVSRGKFSEIHLSNHRTEGVESCLFKLNSRIYTHDQNFHREIVPEPAVLMTEALHSEL